MLTTYNNCIHHVGINKFHAIPNFHDLAFENESVISSGAWPRAFMKNATPKNATPSVLLGILSGSAQAMSKCIESKFTTFQCHARGCKMQMRNSTPAPMPHPVDASRVDASRFPMLLPSPRRDESRRVLHTAASPGPHTSSAARCSQFVHYSLSATVAMMALLLTSCVCRACRMCMCQALTRR